MILYFLSDRRDSNPQHSPWKGDTLPIELLSHLKSFSLMRRLICTSTFKSISNLLHVQVSHGLFMSFQVSTNNQLDFIFY